MSRNRKQKGFTLIELAIAVAVIGLIFTMLFNKFGKGIVTSAKGQQMYQVSKSVADSWIAISQQCGTTLDPATSPLTVAGTKSAYNNLGMLVDPMNTTYGIDTSNYNACFSAVGYRGLGNALAQTASNWMIGDYPITFSKVSSGALSGYIQVTITQVPSETAEQIYNFRANKSGSWTAGTADSSDSRVQYTAASGGTHTVNMFFN